MTCIRKSKYDSEVAGKEKKKSFKDLEILTPHNHMLYEFLQREG